MLSGKKILLGITGSIAAYKTPILVRQLIKNGAEVKVIMTPAAKDFVSSLTLSTLSHNKVLIDLFDEDTWANHVMLGRWADLLLIAPLSCNTLSKMAHGQCDNLLLAIYLSATCPLLIAPAMDEDMWHHPVTKNNISLIEQHGCRIMPVGYGELASGLVGEGRMAEPEEIVGFLEQYFVNSGNLKGKKALVSAGPTYEPIDPVRFIGNHSSGKMGYAIAEELAARGAKVTLVSGPVAFDKPLPGVNIVKVMTAEEMYESCINEDDYDIAVMAAAVADYTPSSVSETKIKKTEGNLELSLKKTKDILKTLGASKKESQVLVGFALETDNEQENAAKKLKDKNADMLILNSLNDEGAGFGYDTNKVTFFFKNGDKKDVALKSKKLLAKDIIDAITELL
ncbi:bifunctional phosphopantothenoylcysteine decarboxylase/phosphopantothenate--cysteine ligase CoaBC [Flavisolibacter ginsengisoli]|jgi:phosphopantothenoylcysteine decarboxylase/phosphopantothenate--cysteine ligase|uniref:Coenzyme A biosynthesis bifunctional protein CoaBC n=1 Tax=Flavisolibacter ginsengisoli DSM 18119 TaxID=1121884 RepID=A0A1M5FBP3_9BACT|nr:bifunctional phosphopantothenoylcysteine decarboxylase/phosphopantothenate--cysteine ligase CoaBC [Flavisolibacter ginsengisoli]SHF88964.1 phosphopantothenoylcysteine decarboxylase / phosphopantothenate--cysteine ligase [Flavisolibacter ginsengisoli DSM 18119]